MSQPIEVRRYGTVGPAVVVLHGGPGAPGSVAALASALGDEFRVSEPLQRRSDDSPLTVARHVDDLSAVLDEPAALVGWSWGAMLGLSFTVQHPELVRSLVLVGCGSYDDASRDHYATTMYDRLGPDGRGRMTELREHRVNATDHDEQDRLFAERGALAGRAQSFDPIPDPDPDDAGLPGDAQGHDETWTDVLRLQADGIEPASFAAIEVPVLMIHGDHDPHPGPATRDTLRSVIPQLEYIELPQCGHTPWRERHAREQFYNELRIWLRAHR